MGFWKKVWCERIHCLGFSEECFDGFEGLQQVRRRFGRLQRVLAP